MVILSNCKVHDVDVSKLSKLSIIEESSPKKIRMANLAIIISHTVNGVAEIHSEILKNELFRDFNEFFPGKFINITNGITARRFYSFFLNI